MLENETKDYREKRNRVLGRMTYLFIFLLGSILLIYILTGDKEYSERENRNLTQKPIVTTDKIIDGTYMTEYEEYVSDQFVFRDFCVVFQGIIGSLLGEYESNGIYKAKDGYLIQSFGEGSEKNEDKQVDALLKFAKTHTDLKQYMVIVPTSVLILEDKLSRNTPSSNQDSYIDTFSKRIKENITCIDLQDTLSKHKDEYIYYKTDHHWTTLGAWYAYQEIAKKMSLKSQSEKDYQVLEVSHEFQGTLSASSGYGLYTYDTISTYLNKDKNFIYLVNEVEEQEKSASFYQEKALESRDQYQVFLGGNHPLVEIETNVDSKRTLLLFKDSYANCMIPFLAASYQKIIMVDPRYYYGDLNELISGEKDLEVMYLYNANTFQTDTSLAPLLLNSLE